MAAAYGWPAGAVVGAESRARRGAVRIVSEPTPAVTKIVFWTQGFYSIATPRRCWARALLKVRTLIGQGRLDARQIRFDSKRFMVGSASIIRFKHPGGPEPGRRWIWLRSAGTRSWRPQPADLPSPVSWVPPLVFACLRHDAMTLVG